MIAGSSVTAGIFGITEPAVYGVNRRCDARLSRLCGGRRGGAIVGFLAIRTLHLWFANIFTVAQMILPVA